MAKRNYNLWKIRNLINTTIFVLFFWGVLRFSLWSREFSRFLSLYGHTETFRLRIHSITFLIFTIETSLWDWRITNYKITTKVGSTTGMGDNRDYESEVSSFYFMQKYPSVCPLFFHLHWSHLPGPSVQE